VLAPDRAVRGTHFRNRSSVMVPASLGAASGMMARESVGKWKTRLARVSWRVDVEAGGKASTLGLGLDQTTAHGLMEGTIRKIAEIRST